MPPESSLPRRQFVTVAQVASLLALGEDDVLAILVSGELPAIKVGPRDEWRIEQSVLDGYLEAKYEEARRAALFEGFDFGSVVDIDPGRRIPPPDDEQNAPR